VGEVDGQHFLSMEYVDGEDLKGLLKRIGRLPSDKGVHVAQQLCAGLAAAHDKGVVHRDLKPANIMIDGRGQVRIMDFGLARLTAGAGQHSGEVSGTPAYMAPEQLAQGQTSIQSDLYSLGLVLYEVFTGKRVHQGESFEDLLQDHQQAAVVAPSVLVENLDPAVERTILRCLNREPSGRPGSARVIAAGLPGGDPLAAAMAAGETPSPEMVAAAGDEGTMKPVAAWMCLAGVVVGLIAAIFLSRWSHRVNQAGLEKHPEAIRREAQAGINLPARMRPETLARISPLAE